MKSPLKSYKFWIEAISAAILLGVGIAGIVQRDFLVPLVVLVTGAIVLVFATIRFIPLMKTLKANRSRFLSIGEFAVNIIVGVILFYGSILIFKDPNSTEGFAHFSKEYYKYFLGGVLYLRGLCYFVCTVLFKEETDQIKFWSHIAFLTLGVCVCTMGVEVSLLALIVAIFALIGSACLIVDAGFNYGRYRKSIAAKREKEKAKEEGTTIAPGVDKPAVEEEIKEVPIEEPTNNDNQPYVS